MGGMKEQMMEAQQKKNDEGLAKALRISYDELTECDWQIDDSDNNGTNLITFSNSSPSHILKKIGVDNSNSIRINESDRY